MDNLSVLTFDLTKKGNKFKILNATNGGPVHKRHASDQRRDNFETYKAARIPYCRNHDSNAITAYGGPYCHDITAIFPNFDVDENDPSSYDFACTDENILVNLEAGSETYFRLGQTIEHQIKKHATLPPKDFKKWARICEHIIRHYNEGWANGFELNIKYWEIWNEPDLDGDDSPNKRNWGGTQAQFFDFFEIAAKHLKGAFPHLKIGGPALAGNEKWAGEFVREMKKRDVPMDFLSWHVYAPAINWITDKATFMRDLLDKNGYENTESILNEWNYVEDWGEKFVYTVEQIHGIKGAAFIAAAICTAQALPIDMLMYYDTRPSVFNGVFDFYTLAPLKGYYPLAWYGKFYDMAAEIPCSNNVGDIYTICGIDKNGKTLTMLSYYTDNNQAEPKKIALDFGKTKVGAKYEIYLLDVSHNGEAVKQTDDLKFTLEPETCLLIKEV